MKPQALASALTKISGGVSAIPQKDLRAGERGQLALHRPGRARDDAADPHGHPPVARAAPRAARPHPGRARPAHRLMRWLDAVTGRRRQAANDLDALFLVPSAAITLETAAGYAPTGVGSVCYRSAAGAAFDRTQDEITRLLDDDPEAPDVTVSPRRLRLHLAGRAGRPGRHGRPLHRPARGQHAARGAGLRVRPAVLDGDRSPATAARSGWSTSTSRAPSTPSRPPARTSATTCTEIAVRDQLAAELPMERDMQRWLALWNAPGL